jgi:hypothetical protein
MRDLGLSGTEGSRFDSVRTINSEGFDRPRLFGSIFHPVGIVPLGTRKLESDQGISDASKTMWPFVRSIAAVAVAP